MGLRDKAAQYRWGTKDIDLDHLEEQYTDKILSKGELIAIKAQIKAKIEQVHSLLDRKLIDMQTLLEISSEVNSTLNIQDLLQIILFTYMGHFQISDIAVFRINSHNAKIIGKQGFNNISDLELPLSFLNFLQQEDSQNQVLDVRDFDLLSKQLEGLNCTGIIPLRAKEGIFGLIVLGSKYDGSSLNDQERDFSLTLGSLAGVALENASLYERLQIKFDELSALYEVSRIINSTDNFDLVQSLVLETLTTGFGITQAVLIISDQEKYYIGQQSGVDDGLIDKKITLSDDEISCLMENKVTWQAMNGELRQLTGTENALWVPLNSIDTNVGALLLLSSDKYELSQDDENLTGLFSIISSQVSPPILMSKLLKDQKDSIVDPFHPVLEKIKEETDKASRYNIDVSFAMFRFQNYKEYLNNHGAQAALNKMEDLTVKLKKILPQNHTLIRYSSKQLLLILPALADTDLEDLKKDAMDLCKKESAESDITLIPEILTVVFPQECDDYQAVLSRIE